MVRTTLADANGDRGRGFTRYTTYDEFQQYCKQNDRDHEKITNALFGPDGRDGIVQEINSISFQLKLIFGAVLFVQPIILSIIIRWIGI